MTSCITSLVKLESNQQDKAEKTENLVAGKDKQFAGLHVDGSEFAGLSISEYARSQLAPVITSALSDSNIIGNEIEKTFTMFWDMARKADDMIDFVESSNLKWLKVMQNTFAICSKMMDNKHALKDEVSQSNWQEVSRYIFNLMSATCRGEIQDLQLSEKKAISDEEYNEMVLEKTGPWFTGRILTTLVAIDGKKFRESPKYSEALLKDLQEYGDLVSLAYQIRNDIQDMETHNKDSDIGKLNYPTILLIRKEQYSLQYSNKKRKVLCQEYGIIEEAKSKALEYEQRAKLIAQKYEFLWQLAELTPQLCS